ncbi:MAG: cation:proton antiporter, partial [Pseudomonadota bacterium]|nr:cation:proton antiporter [Pseudomonadota bacterium]
MEEHAHALSNLAILLVFAYVGGAILEKLKQPALVGYILVGLLLGPSVLGIVHDRETIGFLAEMGIL